MTTDSSAPQQIEDGLRESLHVALLADDLKFATELLAETPLLANTDLRPPEARDEFTHGYPLVIASQRDNAEIARVLLEAGADPDSPSTSESDPPEHGMPLHLATRWQNYALANLLLDRGSDPNSFPHCDQSTVEIAFYQARLLGIPDGLVRRSCAGWLPDCNALVEKQATDCLNAISSDSARLFARLIDAGGMMSMSALLREGYGDLAAEIVSHGADEPGSPHDHPPGTIFEGVLGAARWHGYPAMVRYLMSEYPDRFDYPTLIETIHCAVVSHNRDGAYREYREIIAMQLEGLESRGLIPATRGDESFNPIFTMAEHFTWHKNYGFRAEIATPDCYIDLAELFDSFGLCDVNYLDPDSGQSPLTAAVSRAAHPGIEVFVRWLLEQGADRRIGHPDDVNPLQIAMKQGDAVLIEMLG